MLICNLTFSGVKWQDQVKCDREDVILCYEWRPLPGIVAIACNYIKPTITIKTICTFKIDFCAECTIGMVMVHVICNVCNLYNVYLIINSLTKFCTTDVVENRCLSRFRTEVEEKLSFLFGLQQLFRFCINEPFPQKRKSWRSFNSSTFLASKG